MSTIAISYAHLARLSDTCGIFEHAKFTEPRIDHGYCLDDVSRALIVIGREPEPSERLRALARTYLSFVVGAQSPDGRFRNRQTVDLVWEDDPSLADHWGRAIWALGSVTNQIPELAEEALVHFDISVTCRSPWPRPMAFAALGAAEVLRTRPRHKGARALLESASALIGAPTRRFDWRWPQPRLHYANAALAEALLAVGTGLGLGRTHADGLAMLRWLLAIETSGDHLSVTPVGGWATGEPRPGFDQQPIEVSSLADACARAYDDTSDRRWYDAVMLCEAWFLGVNDTNISLLDPVSGGGCDGLERYGRNENQGAESTLALISTLQQARRLRQLGR
ncbi:glycosyltransferase [Mycobacterium sp. NPDC050853]|uniref:glycosyltransferase n=1 Tax=Mycobacteriaceae TaxID=1762 RepID=UPI0015DD90A8|nr:glycosyltransferase [Mycobacteroides sp. LB1]